ncbi:MAG: radical SAM protein [Candidatus Omnitrophica bacterium]|nr:radical SAM protein [Candidatus Omnitrophota bacterium]
MKKISRILLINPPQVSKGKFLDGYQGTRPVLPALGLAYIAACLEKQNYKVEIFDGMVENATASEIAVCTHGYDLVGITSTTFQVKISYQVLEEIRKENPVIPIVIGGPHVSCLPFEPLEKGLADFCVVGEGEEALLSIINAIEKNIDLTSLIGVAYKLNGQIYPAKYSGMIKDINSLPLPARHLLPIKKYRTSAIRTRKYPATSMITSRGCPMQCNFCFNQLPYRKNVRFISAEKIVEEMTQLVTKYGAKEIHFWDDNFLVNKPRIDRLFAIMQSKKMKISFDCEGTINSFDPEVLKKIKKIGCYSVSYGIESVNQRILDLMGKKTSIEQIRLVVKETKKLGLDVRGYFLFGFPTETKEDVLETINFSKELKLTDATFSLFVPLPGTKAYEMVKDEPEFMKDYWDKIILSEISFPKPPLVYHPRSISEIDLLCLHRLALRKFYLQPRQILNKLSRSLKSYRVFKESLKGLRSLIKG